MATSSRKTINLPAPPAPPPPPIVRDRIVLELSVNEAETLKVILGGITGAGPRRQHVGDVYDALVRAGVRRPSPEITDKWDGSKFTAPETTDPMKD